VVELLQFAATNVDAWIVRRPLTRARIALRRHVHGVVLAAAWYCVQMIRWMRREALHRGETTVTRAAASTLPRTHFVLRGRAGRRRQLLLLVSGGSSGRGSR